MGNDQGDEYERPAHKISVRPFFMDITEVTCEKYLAFIKDTGHRAPPQWTNGSYPAGAGDLPVTGVDWYDASAYAQWAKKRLPTEEEWEFAARSTDGRKYPWGNTWIAGAANAGDSSPQHLLSVGAHPDGKTPSGLMDMIGNAWEWTANDLVPYPNGKLTRRPAGDLKVIRGGSWQELPEQATTTYRGYLRKTGAADYSATGFRCAKDVTPESVTAK
jgi:formylglycine-generating enzyme required for sulfatase activity